MRRQNRDQPKTRDDEGQNAPFSLEGQFGAEISMNNEEKWEILAGQRIRGAGDQVTHLGTKGSTRGEPEGIIIKSNYLWYKPGLNVESVRSSVLQESVAPENEFCKTRQQRQRDFQQQLLARGEEGGNWVVIRSPTLSWQWQRLSRN